jgi:hypothetical protein
MTTLFAKRLAALLTATALVAAPALAQELVTGHAGGAPSAATKAAIAESVAANGAPDPLPANAPTDDYEFMGWCTGILTGHMELYTKVKPQLDLISQRWNSVDEDNKQQAAQQIEGRALLARFRRVMATAEAAKPSLGPVGQASVQAGLDNWSGVEKIDKQAQAYSWMNFGLPVQCDDKVAVLERTPIVVSKAGQAKLRPVVAPTAAGGAQTLSHFFLGDPPPPPADGKEPLVDALHTAPYKKSVVAELAAQKAAAKKAKEDAAKAQKASAATDAGLRPSDN